MNVNAYVSNRNGYEEFTPEGEKLMVKAAAFISQMCRRMHRECDYCPLSLPNTDEPIVPWSRKCIFELSHIAEIDDAELTYNCAYKHGYEQAEKDRDAETLRTLYLDNSYTKGEHTDEM